MDETQARQAAILFGGEPIESAPNLWHLVVTRSDGHLVVFYGDLIAEYEDRECYEVDAATRRIRLDCDGD
jgi:hypothetical protein